MSSANRNRKRSKKKKLPPPEQTKTHRPPQVQKTQENKDQKQKSKLRLERYPIQHQHQARKLLLYLVSSTQDIVLQIFTEKPVRLNELLEAPYALTTHPQQKTPFDFLQVWIPLCRILSQSKSTSFRSDQRRILDEVYTHPTFLWTHGTTIFPQLCGVNGFTPTSDRNEDQLFSYTDIGECFEPVMDLLHLILTHIHDAKADSKVNDFLELLQACLYQCDIAPNLLTKITQKLRLCFVCLPTHSQLVKPPPRKKEEKYKKLKKKAASATELPGSLREGGSRHNNDFQDFRKISNAPTTEEILSTESPFLPDDYTEMGFIEDGVDQYLDKQYRLIREDTLLSFRKAIRYFITTGRKQLKPKEHTFRYKNPEEGEKFTIFTFRDVQVESSGFDWNKGLSVTLKFSHPSDLTTPESRKNYWKNGEGSKLLRPGALLCIVMGIEKQTTSSIFTGISSGVINYREQQATVSFQFLDSTQFHPFLQSSKSITGENILLELRGHFFLTTEAILKTIQSHNSLSIPFQESIISGSFELDTEPPYYLTDKTLSFQSILKDTSKNLTGKPASYKELQQLLQANKNQILLDETQINAFAAVMRPISLIQGPPGTGKSFVGARIVKFLIDNLKNTQSKSINKLHRVPVNTGLQQLPILCICYTNHALDQFLTELISSGVPKNKIVRVGGQSKSESLQSRTLRELRNTKNPNKELNRSFFETKQKFLLQQENFDELESAISDIKESEILEWLEAARPNAYFQFANLSSTGRQDGFTQIGFKSIHQCFNQWRKGKPYPGKCPTKYWKLSKQQRAEKYKKWEGILLEDLVIAMKTCLNDLQQLYDKKEQIRAAETIPILQDSYIIGMTTSGCAKYHSLVSSLGPRIIICEEAGEVLESHIIAALGANTEHLILIGDHLQLRPKLNEYFLTRESRYGYSLDVSLFERFVHQMSSKYTTEELNQNGMLVTLSTQRRMKPCISNLIRKTLYPNLEDYENVQRYPEVTGLTNALWFFDHDFPESQDANGLGSYTNPGEIDFIVELTRYLIRQGYTDEGDITILTPYLGQLMKLRRRLAQERMQVFISDRDQEELDKLDDSNEYHDAIVSIGQQIRISTVDNFQGEESKIILVSTVRCNKQGTIGFLKTPSRANVMLSRAKHGMILFGSRATILKQNKTAKSILGQSIKILQENHLVGSQLSLTCKLHGNETIVQSAKDMRSLAIDGGCNLPCKARLSCGHSCKRNCHPDDTQHLYQECNEQCIKKCDLGHPCTLACKEQCKCKVNIQIPNALSCGHSLTLPCFQKQDKTLYTCNKKIKISNPYCSHSVLIPCKYRSDAKKLKLYLSPCRNICKEKLPCGHECGLKCSDCSRHTRHPTGINPAPVCQKIESHTMLCGHLCEGLCGHSTTDCPPCTKLCETKCIHSHCPEKCSSACVICAEPCAWQCDHKENAMPPCPVSCGSPCTRLPCNLPCTKKLSCGHACPSICGEKCPDPKYACPICVEENYANRNICVLDTSLTIKSSDWDPTIDPVIQLECSHVATVDTLDGIFAMHTFYEQDARTMKWKDIKAVTTDSLKEIQPFCPWCRRRIFNLSRYGRPLNFLAEQLIKRKLLKEVETFCNKKRLLLGKWKDQRTPPNTKTVTDTIRNCSNFRKRMQDKDPTKALWERSSRDANSSTRIASQFLQPYTKMHEVALQILMFYISIETDKSTEFYNIISNGIRDGIELAQICEQEKMRATGKRCIEYLVIIVQSASESLRKQYYEQLKALGDGRLVNVITLEEKKMILKAMQKDVGSGIGSFGGHWFECRNGHVYTIGECGGAMQESTCPECGDSIGGSAHRLNANNRVATQFLRELDPELIPSQPEHMQF